MPFNFPLSKPNKSIYYGCESSNYFDEFNYNKTSGLQSVSIELSTFKFLSSEFFKDLYLK